MCNFSFICLWSSNDSLVLNFDSLVLWVIFFLADAVWVWCSLGLFPWSWCSGSCRWSMAQHTQYTDWEINYRLQREFSHQAGMIILWLVVQVIGDNIKHRPSPQNQYIYPQANWTPSITVNQFFFRIKLAWTWVNPRALSKTVWASPCNTVAKILLKLCIMLSRDRFRPHHLYHWHFRLSMHQVSSGHYNTPHLIEWWRFTKTIKPVNVHGNRYNWDKSLDSLLFPADHLWILATCAWLTVQYMVTMKENEGEP